MLDAISSIDFEPFDIRLEGLGAFGDLWWAGIGTGSEELKALAAKLRHELSEAGISFDRKRFSPHITLIRRARFTDDFTPGEEDFASWRKPYLTVERISLMRSDRTKHGMVYTEIR